MDKMDLGSRMKDYENVSRIYLTKKLPIIIRLDGKAFHTFTKGMKKPFDEVLMRTMQETCKFLCQNIQGCKLAYTQSDEISLLLVDYDKIESQQWFENNIQKIVSVSASMATLAFNKAFLNEYTALADSLGENASEKETEYLLTIHAKLNSALFDSRVFVLPKEEETAAAIIIGCVIIAVGVSPFIMEIFSEAPLEREAPSQTTTIAEAQSEANNIAIINNVNYVPEENLVEEIAIEPN